MMGFLKDNLGMTVLRHEEFDQGCEATWYILVYVFFFHLLFPNSTCFSNGPYQNRWSKTMIGYGPESSNFVLEITYVRF